MLAVDETALICDLAETYSILDYRSINPTTLAALAVGLGEDSRIYRKLTGTEVSVNTFLLAGIYDRLSILCWRQTKDGAEGSNPPASILDLLSGDAHEDTTDELVGFDSAEDYEAYAASIKGVNT